MTTNDNCKGCQISYGCPLSRKHSDNCPCISCLVKPKCLTVCEKLDKYSAKKYLGLRVENIVINNGQGMLDRYDSMGDEDDVI